MQRSKQARNHSHAPQHHLTPATRRNVLANMHSDAEMKVAPEDFLQCHVFNDQVYVFYCFAGRTGVTNEGIDLFPSDQLITQFRLVLT